MPRKFFTRAENPGSGLVDVTQALATRNVLETGQVGQTRAGRQLSTQDFLDLGLQVPVGLFNLSSIGNAGSAGALTNKGAVPFAPGVTGAAAEAALFAGSSAQALYVSDTGAADSFRIRGGSWGCWFKTAKRGQAQYVFGKLNAALTQLGWAFSIGNQNLPIASISPDGTGFQSANGLTDVCDDKWHFAVCVYEPGILRLYIDGTLEGYNATTVAPIFSGSGPVNIGGYGADGATATVLPFFGKADEAFVTGDILSEDQVRLLYAVKLAHGAAASPRRASVDVRRRRRGGFLATADFPATPLRLYNLGQSPSVTGDLGSNNAALAVATPGTGTTDASGQAGPDGIAHPNGNAVFFAGGHGGLSGSDTGLPSGVATRSFGVWYRSVQTTQAALIGWGTAAANTRLVLQNGYVYLQSTGQQILGGHQALDGNWHHAVGVEDNAAADGGKMKLYFDGRLVAFGTSIGSITLGGAGFFRLGVSPGDNSLPLTGTLARAFVTSSALTCEQVNALYQKGSQDLGMSPKDVGDHIERFDAASLYFIGDTLDPQHQVELEVAS